MEAVSTFPSCNVYLFCIKKERKKICKLQNSVATHSRPFKTQKMVLWQEDGSDNPVEFNISIVHMRFVIPFISEFKKKSYSGCSRLCEAVIMYWMQYFCPLLSVITAVSELNITLNSCQGDKCLETFLFNWKKCLLLFLFS